MLSRYNFRRVYQRAVARAGQDLAAVDPHGPFDLRHTFSTWLEDACIPARVIDELMGHERSRRGATAHQRSSDRSAAGLIPQPGSTDQAGRA
jgi:integrase